MIGRTTLRELSASLQKGWPYINVWKQYLDVLVAFTPVKSRSPQAQLRGRLDLALVRCHSHGFRNPSHFFDSGLCSLSDVPFGQTKLYAEQNRVKPLIGNSHFSFVRLPFPQASRRCLLDDLVRDSDILRELPNFRFVQVTDRLQIGCAVAEFREVSDK